MRILYVTTIGKTMRFFESFVQELIREGHTVDIATNEINSPVPECYRALNCKVHQISFSRSPLAGGNVKACGQLKRVIQNGGYDMVHCHTPNAAVITRLVCRKFRKKNGLKVFYTAHGFHFYQGAPKLNWLLFYPIEKFCARLTDTLITINREDYELAKSKFKANEIHYVPGVGINLSRFENASVDRAAKRQELGVPMDAVLLVSVGELIERKNHKLILQAMSKIDNDKLHYIIAGTGPMLSELQGFADQHGLTGRVQFLGYRRDIAELYKAADLCCFPSFHEGLPVALMEAMTCGLPVVCSRIRGNVDLIDKNGGRLFDPHNADDCCRAMTEILSLDGERMGEVNRQRVTMCSMDKVIEQMKTIYKI